MQPSFQDTPPMPSGQIGGLRVRRTLQSSLLVFMILVCVLGGAVAIAAIGGVAAGQQDLNIRATQTTTAEIDVQFALGIEDMEAGRFGLAAQRFRWVLERSPDYPGAQERLSELAAQQSIGGTPESTIPPSDAETAEEFFAEAQGFFESEQWESAVDRLERVQALDPSYREIEVKEMLFQSLQTLGLLYVRGDRIEEGLFLLERAEQIQPLEDWIAGERNLAELYITGMGYWELNWRVVVQNLEIIYQAAPGYRDVRARLLEAHDRYGDLLADQGAYCDALAQYDAALLIETDPERSEKQQMAEEECGNPTTIPTATNLGELPVATGTPGPTPTSDAMTGTAPTPSATPPGGGPGSRSTPIFPTASP